MDDDQVLVVAQRPVPAEPPVTTMPESAVKAVTVAYRSVGCGAWGVLLRFLGMPLEKIALFANSSLVSGKHQLREAARLTFANGCLAPYRVVGGASLLAWFLQYSSMSFVFQLADAGLSHALSAPRVPYGDQVLQAGEVPHRPSNYGKDLAAATVAGVVESAVSNRAEAQRYYGLDTFKRVPSGVLGPAFLPSASRNTIMAYSAFVATPVLFQSTVPLEYKSSSSLFVFGLAVNMFLGNALAVTQQALWGRSLDALLRLNTSTTAVSSVSYGAVIRDGLRRDGLAAFLTPSKWFARILMNAPAEGTLSWFYNNLLPIAEPAVLRAADALHRSLLRTRTHSDLAQCESDRAQCESSR